MPFGNGTGPAGAGPMTGRGAGYCSGNRAPGNTSATPVRRWFNFSWLGSGRRPGQGRGRSAGRGNRSRW